MDVDISKIEEARKQGYSDKDIARHLGGDKYQQAIDSGYSDRDIIAHFSKASTPSQSPGFVQTVLSSASRLARPYDLPYTMPPQRLGFTGGAVQDKPPTPIPLKSVLPSMPQGTMLQKIAAPVKAVAQFPTRAATTIGKMQQSIPYGTGQLIGSNLRQKLASKYPNVANKVGPTLGVLGATVGILPELVTGGQLLKSVTTGDTALAKGIREGPNSIGKDINELESGPNGAGINQNQPVIVRGSRARWAPYVDANGKRVILTEETGGLIPPQSYPGEPGDFIRFVNKRLDDYGDSLSPQELKQLNKAVPEIFRKNTDAFGKFKGSDDTKRLLTELGQRISKVFDASIKGREFESDAYAVSKSIHPDFAKDILPLVKKYGKKALALFAAGALGGAGAKKGWELFH